MAPAVLYIFQLMGPSNELLVHEPFRSSDCRRLNPSPRILSSKVASVLRLSTACVEVSPRRRSILSSKILSLSYKSSYETILSSQPCVGHCINKVRPFYKVFTGGFRLLQDADVHAHSINCCGLLWDRCSICL